MIHSSERNPPIRLVRVVSCRVVSYYRGSNQSDLIYKITTSNRDSTEEQQQQQQQ